MIKTIAVNRKAYYDYEILETLEAGIRLTGAEMKSVRQKRVNLRGSYVKILGSEAYLLGSQIAPYPYAHDPDYKPRRTRKLLLRGREISRLIGKSREKGLALIPLKLYLKDNIAKLEIGVGKAKKKWDKREVIKKRELRREIEQATR